MKKIIKGNKIFFFVVVMFLLSATVYYIYKLKVIDITIDGIEKEKVALIIRNNEITWGLPPLVKEFNENNDHIYIELDFEGSDYNNIVLTKLANKIDVDIVEYMGKTQIEKEFLQPLDQIGIDYSTLGEGSLLKYNDDVIGIKYGSYIPKLMYNDEILMEAGLDPSIKPATFDQLIAMLEVIKEKIPNITPLSVDLTNIHDLFSFLGNIAASDDSIYPTFWNYKTGEYTYEALKPVLEKFKYMYNSGLVNNDFSEKVDKGVLDEFRDGEAAIVYTNSGRKYSIADRTFNLDVSFSDIPQLTKVEGKRYYVTSQRILTIADNIKDKEILSKDELEEVERHEKAVKEVFEWLLSQETIDYLVSRDANYATFGVNPFNGGTRIYDPLSYDIGYKQSILDPTEVLAGNSSLIQNSIYSLILEDKDVNIEVDKLYKGLNDFIKSNIRNEDLEFERYKE